MESRKQLKTIPINKYIITDVDLNVRADLSSGIKIADINVAGKTTSLYVPEVNVDFSEISATIARNYVSCVQVVSTLGDSHTLVPDQWLLSTLASQIQNHTHALSDLTGYDTETWKFRLEGTEDYVEKTVLLVEK